MIVDLHTHTRFGSNCSYLDPGELVWRAKEVGLDGVCITEHELCWEVEALNALSQEYGIVVLGGVEVSTELGQVLVFGIHQPLWGISSMKELRAMVQTAGGVMIASHPFRGLMVLNEPPSVEETIAIAVVAPGYKAHVLGTVTSFDELSNFSTLQEGVSSTSLMLAPMSCSC